MPDSRPDAPLALPRPALSAVLVDRLARRPRATIGQRNEFALLDLTHETLFLLDSGQVQVTTDVTIDEIVTAEGIGLEGPVSLIVRGEGRVQIEVQARKPKGGLQRLESRSAELADGAMQMRLFPVVGRYAHELGQCQLVVSLQARGDVTITGVEISDTSGTRTGMIANLALGEEGVMRYPIRARLLSSDVPVDREALDIVLPEATTLEIATGFTLTRRFLEDRDAGSAPLALSLSGAGAVVAQVYALVGKQEDKVLLYQDQIDLDPQAQTVEVNPGESDLLATGFQSGDVRIRLMALEDTRVTEISLDSATPPSEAQPIVLQNLVFADPKICNEPQLFVHLNPRAFTRMGTPGVTFLKGGVAIFDTYFNLLNLGNWFRHCALENLELLLRGRGRASLHVWMAAPKGHSPAIAFDDIVELTEAGVTVDLTPCLSEPMLQSAGGVIMFKLTAIEDAELHGGAFRTRTPPQREPKLAISITTFRREAEVTEAARKLAAFAERFEDGERVGIFIVDNGQTAQIAPHPLVTYVPNANLGGAGGFARGLAEATEAGYTHCLFMDDDASFLTESFVRAYSYLRLARAKNAAICGAMISNARKWAMWENGAVFDQFCRPQFVGQDLRVPGPVLEMEFKSAQPKPEKFYGGWWFFGFPIAEVKHHPFPFFVRGDDINFSLANKFSFATMSGVVSFQDDFSAKESALNLYLDLRNHIVQHLVFPEMELGAWGLAKVPLRFVWRSLSRFHYESAEAKLQAWEDVLEGPQFFAENADMAARRKSIGATINQEKWRPMDLTTAPKERFDSPYPGPVQKLFAATANGHFLPFISRDRVSVPVEHRGLLFPIWGAREITFTNGAAGTGYTVRMDRTRGFRILRRAWALARRTRREYPQLISAYRKGYAEIATPEFWQGQFGTEEKREVA